MERDDPQIKKRISVREGLFTTPLLTLDQVRLIGSKCGNCNEISLGKQIMCSNCGASRMEEIPLSRKGKLWTYTVIRHRPPGDYKGPDPFVPFGLGLVELPEGIRVLSPIHCDLKKIDIGMDLELGIYPLFTDEDNNEVMAFRFRPVSEESK
jgi:uncharacterized OB-fold protein